MIPCAVFAILRHFSCSLVYKYTHKKKHSFLIIYFMKSFFFWLTLLFLVNRWRRRLVRRRRSSALFVAALRPSPLRQASKPWRFMRRSATFLASVFPRTTGTPTKMDILNKITVENNKEILILIINYLFIIINIGGWE